MAIRTATLRTEVERHRASGGAGVVSHRVPGPRVLPALGDYATGIAAFSRGVFDLGTGIMNHGRNVKGMEARNDEILSDNKALDEKKKLDPAKADFYEAQKTPELEFSSYW